MMLRVKSLVYCLLGFVDGDHICKPCLATLRKLSGLLPVHDVVDMPALAMEVRESTSFDTNTRSPLAAIYSAPSAPLHSAPL